MSLVFGVGGGGGKIKALTRCNKELSSCCLVAAPRMLYINWYTSLAPSVEGADNESRSTATAAMF
jgi:hypothetical protein